MLGMRCIFFIFLVVCFFQGSLAIEVSFSAEDGGEFVSISVSEESEAESGNLEMTNTRDCKFFCSDKKCPMRPEHVETTK